MNAPCTPVPFHVAIIMDGNGRWAKRRGLPRLLGHRAGVHALERVVRAAPGLGITHLSVYAFSTENWQRPSTEILGLMSILRVYLKRKVRELKERDVRLLFCGTRAGLSPDVADLMAWAEEETSSNSLLTLIPCFNYGGRQEILDAVNALVAEGRSGPVDQEDIRRHLYLPDLPDPDLIIRTSGEQRLSNFWAWQGTYSELYFTDTLWPDFDGECLERAVQHFADRERRYGALA